MSTITATATPPGRGLSPNQAGDGPPGYLVRNDHAPGETIPVVGAHEGVPFDLGGVPVWEILRYSVDVESP